MKYVLKITLKDALELGLVHCANCGYPPNNHFDFGKRPCAHDSNCKEYKQSFSRGVELKD